MPIVGIPKDFLFERLGREFTDDEFQNLCFDFGIELDDVTSEKQMLRKETGKEESTASETIIYKVEIPANRYDLLCCEGLTLALKVFMETSKMVEFSLSTPESIQVMTIDPNVLAVRPFVICATLRNINFTKSSYNSFIEFQDKLHTTICRHRSIASIGTHDLDTVQGPFTYTALPPEEIVFAPLNSTEEVNARQLFANIEQNELHLKPYLKIIRDFPVYPVIKDSNGVVLSLPPIINGNHSKISMDTKNVFIEVTATDKTKAEIVCGLVSMFFSFYCDPPNVVEAVQVQNPESEKSSLTPTIEYRTENVSKECIVNGLGVEISIEKIISSLNKMGLHSNKKEREVLEVIIPPHRSDILHVCDIVEDVGIAYGYNNITPMIPQTVTVGKQQFICKLTELLCREMAFAGFTEVIAWSLCSLEDNFASLLRPQNKSAVLIGNPKTAEFQCGRITLLPGLLKSCSVNKSKPLPLKIFEIGDVILNENDENNENNEKETEVGARNERRLCALYTGPLSGFEIIHGLLDRIMLVLNIPPAAEFAALAAGTKIDPLVAKKQDLENKLTYRILPFDEDPIFLSGRAAKVLVNNEEIGSLGVLHPNVLENFDIQTPCSILEVNVQKYNNLA